MLLALLLQAGSLLPAPAPFMGALDADYTEQLQLAAAAEALAADQAEKLRPQSALHTRTVAGFIWSGDDAAARLGAVLLAGTRDDAAARALFAAACRTQTTNTAVACLLAPARIPPGTEASLAYLAQDPSRSLNVRAAAIARLFDADEAEVWPLARALFEGGTRVGLNPPSYADWPSTTRWELAKRLVLMSFNEWLARHGQGPCNFEPNAAWEDQLVQIEDAEQRWQAARAAASTSPERAYAAQRLHLAQVEALLQRASDGDAIAARALWWLRAHARTWLEAQALGNTDTTWRRAAQQALDGPQG